MGSREGLAAAPRESPEIDNSKPETGSPSPGGETGAKFSKTEFQGRFGIPARSTIFKGTTPKSSIARLRFVRQDVAIADVSGEITGFPKAPPAGVPVGADGVLRFKLLLVLIKEQGVWWITEYHNVAVTPEA